MFYETILDSDINFDNIALKSKDKKLRMASRGILLYDENPNLIGIFYKENMNEYKLPGGGLELNDQPDIAFKREVLEETGYNIKNEKLIGITTEIKSKLNFIQTSFVFVATKVGEQTQPTMTEKEIAEGGKFLWLDINDAIKKMEASIDKLKAGIEESVYSTTFVVKRDILILKNYLKLITTK